MSAALPVRSDEALAAARDVTSRLAAHADPATVDRDAFAALVRYEVHARDAPAGPTRTRTIQQDYEADAFTRFRRVKGLIRETVVANDALGLTNDSSTPGVPVSPQALEVNADDPAWWKTYAVERRRGVVNADPARDFDFPRSGEKAEAFLDWLQGVEDDEVLEIVQRSGGRIVARDRWQDVYVRRSYGRGLKHANARLREAGVDVDAIDDVVRLFNQPIHAETLSQLFTRNFTELQGITDAMDQEISRQLTQGFAEGWGPRKMARELNDRVDAVGITRARTMARTETIRTHSEATLNRYERMLGPDAQVTGKAEWRTAGDDRVCPICEGLEGQTFALDEARGMLPIHPNCRCSWLPVVGSANVATAPVDTIVAQRVYDHVVAG